METGNQKDFISSFADFIRVLIVMLIKLIAEAISLSNRVIVFSKRPCQIKKIYEIHLSGKNSPIENRKAKEFLTYYDLIWKDLDVNV